MKSFNAFSLVAGIVDFSQIPSSGVLRAYISDNMININIPTPKAVPEWAKNDRALLYVGLTRAQTFLCISWTKGTPLTAEIEAAVAAIETETRTETVADTPPEKKKSLAEGPAKFFRWWR